MDVNLLILVSFFIMVNVTGSVNDFDMLTNAIFYELEA